MTAGRAAEPRATAIAEAARRLIEPRGRWLESEWTAGVLVRVVGTARDASVRDSDGGGYLQRRVPLTILPRPPASIALNAPGPPFHAGTEVTLEATPLDDNVDPLARLRGR